MQSEIIFLDFGLFIWCAFVLPKIIIMCGQNCGNWDKPILGKKKKKPASWIQLLCYYVLQNLLTVREAIYQKAYYSQTT